MQPSTGSDKLTHHTVLTAQSQRPFITTCSPAHTTQHYVSNWCRNFVTTTLLRWPCPCCCQARQTRPLAGPSRELSRTTSSKLSVLSWPRSEVGNRGNFVLNRRYIVARGRKNKTSSQVKWLRLCYKQRSRLPVPCASWTELKIWGPCSWTMWM